MSTNATLVADPHLCTLQTCNLTLASLSYLPSLGGNTIYALIFAGVLAAQLTIGTYYRTWTFLAAFTSGTLLEIIGYVARIQMHNHPFAGNPFLIYLITLTIAPCFWSAGIYLCLSRIILTYSPSPSSSPTLARFRPRTSTRLFIACDIFSLVLQAFGGALADNRKKPHTAQTGVNIMIAGLACQVVSLSIFIALCADFAWRVRGARGAEAVMAARERSRALGCPGRRFGGFLVALAMATMTIFIRSIFRVAELHGGFRGKLADDQGAFMVLEGGMVIIASVALTVMHPRFVFTRFWGRWRVGEIGGGGRVGMEGGGGKGDVLLERGGFEGRF